MGIRFLPHLNVGLGIQDEDAAPKTRDREAWLRLVLNPIPNPYSRKQKVYLKPQERRAWINIINVEPS